MSTKNFKIKHGFDAAGNSTVTGSLTATSLVGPLQGNVVGNVAGNVTGNVTGNLTGNVAGHLNGTVTGDVTGNVTGNLTGNVTGDLFGSVVGNVTGNLTGNVAGNLTGNVTGSHFGNVTGNVTGNVAGNVTGNLTGNVAGNASTATALSTARTIALSGDAVASGTFNGSSDLNLSVALAATGVGAGTYGSTTMVPVITVDAKGRITSATAVALPGSPVTSVMGKTGDVLLDSDDIMDATDDATADTIVRRDAAGAFSSNTITATSFVGPLSGNAATATRLATARTLSTTGDATGSASFDGSANAAIALTLVNTAVTPGTYGSATSASVITVDAKGRVTSASSAAIAFPVTTVAGRTGAVTIASADITDATSTNTPNTIARRNASGVIAANLTGNASTADALSTARTIAVAGDVTGSASFNGSANATINSVLAATAVTPGTYGSATESARITVDSKGRITGAQNAAILFPVSSVAGRTGAVVLTSADLSDVSSTDVSNTLVKRDASGNFAAGQITASLAGNALTASKLIAARTISVLGDASGSASFDGSANAAITLTLGTSGVVAGTYGSSTTIPVIEVDAKGRVVSASTIAAPSAPVTSVAGKTGAVTLVSADITDATNANTVNTLVKRDVSGNFSAGTITAALSGNATTATRLATARTISLTSDVTGSVSFDGSANGAITATLASTAVTAGSYGSATSVGTFTVDGKGRLTTAGTAAIAFPVSSVAGRTGAVTIASADITDATEANTPSTLIKRDASGNFAAGTITANLTGTASLAANATKLATARTLGLSGDLTGSASFDGSANATIAATLAASGAAAGTYTKVTVDTKGRVTSGANLASGDVTTALGYTPFDPTTGGTIGGSTTFTGDVVFQGTTTQINSTQLTLTDPLVTLGSNSTSTNDGKDRGVEFRYGNGSAIKTGFFGYRATTSEFVFIPDATTTGDVATGAVGTIVANLSGLASTATALATARNIAVTGDITGTASFNGTADASIATTLAASGVTAGTYGSATQIPILTVDAKGRVTVATTTALSTGSAAWKDPVRVVSVANITLTAPGTAIDGVTLANGDRVLLTAQTTASQNGIYVFNGSASTMTRSGDANTTALMVSGLSVTVTEGTANADTVWMLTTNNPYTLDTTALTFVKMQSGETRGIANLATTGLLARTAAGTYSLRTITPSAAVTTGGTGYIVVTNGNGVSANPTLALVAATTNTASTLVARDASGNFAAGTITAAVTGNATTATTLQTARNIALSGDATGTVSFNGSADVSIATTLASTTVSPGSYGNATSVASFTVDAKGRLTSAGNTSITFPVTSVASKTGAVTLVVADIGGLSTELANIPRLNLSNTFTASQQIAAATGASTLTLNNSSAAGSFLMFEHSGIDRWAMTRDGSTGHLKINRYDGTGALTDSPLVIDSATATAQFIADVGVSGGLNFGSNTRQMINLWNTSYGIGVQPGTLYNRVVSNDGFAWYSGGTHSNTTRDPGAGGTMLLDLRTTTFQYKGGDIYHAGSPAGAIKPSHMAAAFIGNNLVPNPSFENDLDGWGAAGTVSIVTGTGATGGEKCAAITVGTAPALTSASYIPVTAGDTYVLTAYAKTNTATAAGFYLRAMWFKNDKSASTVSYIDAIGNGALTTSWVKYGGRLTAPADAKFAQVLVYHYTGSTATTMNVDDISFVRAIDGTNLASSIALEGVPTAPTAATATNTNQVATTAHVQANAALKLNLTGGTMTGVLVAPTIVSGNELVSRGGGPGAEGGQLTLGWGNNLATNITGQGLNTWNIDVINQSDLRFYATDGSGVSRTALTISGTSVVPTFMQGPYISCAWPTIQFNKTANGQANQIQGNSHTGSPRWLIRPGNDELESSGNLGSNFGLYRYDDAGNYIDGPLHISRATGQASFTVRPAFAGQTPWDTGNFNPGTKRDITTITITDWNNATYNGDFMAVGAANAPTASEWYIGKVTAHNGDWVTQEVWQFSGNSNGNTMTYRREKDAGGWGAWVRVYETEPELDNRFAQRITPTVVDTLTVTSSSAGNGWMSLQTGTASNPGYAAYYTADGTRRGYVGWNDSSNLVITGEAGWGWQFNTNLTHGTGLYAASVAVISAAGTTQATATEATMTVVIVNAGTGGVRLPLFKAGTITTVINTLGTAISVYPNTGAKIEALATNAAFTLGAGARLQFVCASATQWYAMTGTYG